MRAQLGAPTRNRVELIERQLVVDPQRAEVALRGEIVGDEPDELGRRRVAEPAEQDAAARRIEPAREQLVEPLVGDLAEIGAELDGLDEQRRAVERARCEPRRARRIDLGDLGFVPVRDAELIADVVGGARRIVDDPAQQLTDAQPIVARALAVALGPHVEHGVGICERARVLCVETSVVVVVLAAGEQLRDSRGSIAGQREGFEDLQVHPRNLSAIVRAMYRPLLIVASIAALGAGVAVARPHGRADNMPRGWTWPPSKTMVAAAKACEAKLDELGVTWQSAKREGHVVDAIAVAELGGIAYTDVFDKRVPVMDCQLALALATVAPRLYELGVREVRVGSTYRWTKVRVGGKTKDMLSRHALGIAMDVVSFIDDSGRDAVVAKDYKDGDELLLAIERAIDDSGTFRLVLTPKNDPISHKDHFHLEANPDYSDATEDKPSS